MFLCGLLENEHWFLIVERAAKACHFEIRKVPDEATRVSFLFFREVYSHSLLLQRMSLLKLAAALSLRSEGERMEHLAEQFMPLLAREMLRKSAKCKIWKYFF